MVAERLLQETPSHVEVTVGGSPVQLWGRKLPAARPEARRKFLLLHGNPAHIAHFSPNLEFLRRHGDVALYDAPGFGRSPTCEGPLCLDFLSDVAGAFADRLGWTSGIDVIGHSHGGAVAQTLAARSPRHVRTVTLLCTMGVPAHLPLRLSLLPGASGFAHAIARRADRFPYAALARAIARVASRVTFYPDAVPSGFWEHELALAIATPEIHRSCIRVNAGDPTRQLRAQASRIAAPVLAIHGRDDRLVPLAFGRRLFDLLAANHPRNRFEAVEGGHMVHFTRPDIVHALLQEWLELEPEGQRDTR